MKIAKFKNRLKYKIDNKKKLPGVPQNVHVLKCRPLCNFLAKPKSTATNMEYKNSKKLRKITFITNLT